MHELCHVKFILPCSCPWTTLSTRLWKMHIWFRHDLLKETGIFFFLIACQRGVVSKVRSTSNTAARLPDDLSFLLPVYIYFPWGRVMICLLFLGILVRVLSLTPTHLFLFTAPVLRSLQLPGEKHCTCFEKTSTSQICNCHSDLLSFRWPRGSWFHHLHSSELSHDSGLIPCCLSVSWLLHHFAADWTYMCEE